MLLAAAAMMVVPTGESSQPAAKPPVPQPKQQSQATPVSPPVPPSPSIDDGPVGVAWLPYSTALRRSQESGKPVLAFVTQQSCAPCRVIEQLQQLPEIAQFINDHFEPVRFSLDAFPNALNVSQTPAHVLIHDGLIRLRHYGLPQSRDGYLRCLQADVSRATKPNP